MNKIPLILAILLSDQPFVWVQKPRPAATAGLLEYLTKTDALVLLPSHEQAAVICLRFLSIFS